MGKAPPVLRHDHFSRELELGSVTLGSLPFTLAIEQTENPMGLDLVEFIMDVEQSFQLAIPDEDAAGMVTPGILVDYLADKLAETSSGRQGCLEQQAFYRLREGAIQVFKVDRNRLTPDTPWTEIMPQKQAAKHWRSLGQAVSISPWPRATLLGFMFPPWGSTIGKTCRHLAVYAPAALLRKPAALLHENEKWTRPQIETVIAGLIREDFGITKFEWDHEFVRDFGID